MIFPLQKYQILKIWINLLTWRKTPYMSFLPYEKLSYRSPLTQEEAMKRLSVKIDPNPPFLNWKFGKLEQPFKGEINGNKFRISKILSNSRNSIPYFFGEIRENNEGSTIDIIIKPKTAQIGALALFYGIFLFGGLTFTLTDNFIWPEILFPVGVLVFLYTITTIAFKFQASFVKDDLEEIFEIKEMK